MSLVVILLFILIIIIAIYVVAFRNKYSNFEGGSESIDIGPTIDNLQKMINSNSVVIFSFSFCPYCKRAKAALKNANIAYKSYELDKMKNGEQIKQLLLEMTGQRTVPNIFINGKHIGGSDDLQKYLSKK